MYEVTVRRYRETRDRLRVATTRMSDLMKPPETVVKLDTSIDAMMDMFIAQSVKFVYVVDDDGSFRGVVALRDLTARVRAGNSERLVAADVHATRDPMCSRQKCRSARRWNCFELFRGERLPVINSQLMSQHLVGVVYKTALLECVMRMNPENPVSHSH